MNYVLVSLGSIPNHLKYCINTIHSVDLNSKIYLITDQNPNFDKVRVIDSNILNDNKISLIKSYKLYENPNFASNPLWITSLLRIFYLYSFSKIYNIKNFVHFDNDVLIYQSFERINEFLDQNKLNITPLTSKQLIFSYSYFPNLFSLESLTDFILEYINIHLESIKRSHIILNEMDYLGLYFENYKEKVNLLPILPYQNNTLFDPATYGQYLGGTHSNKYRFYKKRFVASNHIVGPELSSGRIKPKFENRAPLIDYSLGSLKGTSEIVNLHIHSKELYKFLPKEYVAYN